MSVLSCLSQKGGVGKSTIACGIATTNVLLGRRAVVADFHVKQRTSTYWQLRREENRILPAVMVIPCSLLYQVDDLACRNDLVVIDDGASDEKRTFELALRSDVIVLPSSVTHIDLASTIRFADELIALGVERRRIIFVLTLTLPNSNSSIRHAKSCIANANYFIADRDIRSSSGYQYALDRGYSIVETRYTTLSSYAFSLVGEIKSRMQTVANYIT